jgi:predicted  nucleic acid-binding Zn-ribbon protein
MPTPTIERLLILQDRDQKRLVLENQLRAVPREIGAVERRIVAAQATLEAARGELQQLELKKKATEKEIGAAAEQMARYKSQQLLVRKNDEYQALGVEISHTQAGIGDLEEQELVVMYSIDEAKRNLAAAGEELRRDVSGHEARIRMLHESEAVLQSELKALLPLVAVVRQEIDETTRRLYDRLATSPGLPVVVAIHDGMCGGCHLKISANVDSEIRRGDKLLTCDQCGRIVFWEA